MLSKCECFYHSFSCPSLTWLLGPNTIGYSLTITWYKSVQLCSCHLALFLCTKQQSHQFSHQLDKEYNRKGCARNKSETESIPGHHNAAHNLFHGIVVESTAVCVIEVVHHLQNSVGSQDLVSNVNFQKHILFILKNGCLETRYHFQAETDNNS